MLYLLPQIEHSKIRIHKEEIEYILELLLNENKNLMDLCFLSLNDFSVSNLKELNMVIRKYKLIDDYLIKYVNNDLYLWL